MFKNNRYILLCMGLFLGTGYAEVEKKPMPPVKHSINHLFTNTFWNQLKGEGLLLTGACIGFKSGVPYIGAAVGSACLLGSLGGIIAAPAVNEVKKNDKLTTFEVYESLVADLLATLVAGGMLAYACPERIWLRPALLGIYAAKCLCISYYEPNIEKLLQKIDLKRLYSQNRTNKEFLPK